MTTQLVLEISLGCSSSIFALTQLSCDVLDTLSQTYQFIKWLDSRDRIFPVLIAQNWVYILNIIVLQAVI